MSRYSLRFGSTRVPMVEVLVDGYMMGKPTKRVVKRVYGFTTQHAYRRALSWARKNGDPR